MSLKGKMLGKGEAFREAINAAASQMFCGNRPGIFGTEKIIGYVCNIHDPNDENDELRGTVDVQEYNCDAGDVNGQPTGYHEGVFLSAVQDNKTGFYVVPQLYSDVVIVQDTSSQTEYVIMMSHVKAVRLNSHDTLHLGVTQYENFVETDDGLEKDYDELEETGKKSSTDYTAESIRDEVSIDGKGLVEEKTAEKKTVVVGDTKITIDGSTVIIETGDTVTIKADKADIQVSDASVKGESVTVDGNNVKITGGKLTVNGTSNVDGMGPFNAIKACPFSGAPHGGSIVSGT